MGINAFLQGNNSTPNIFATHLMGVTSANLFQHACVVSHMNRIWLGSSYQGKDFLLGKTSFFEVQKTNWKHSLSFKRVFLQFYRTCPFSLSNISNPIFKVRVNYCMVLSLNSFAWFFVCFFFAHFQTSLGLFPYCAYTYLHKLIYMIKIKWI